jgi:hypothetical protein
MSSLLQFGGKTGKRGVQLQFTRTGEPAITCTVCGGQHQRIYTAWRKPAGMFGCWVVFRYNGEEHVPDLSIPIDVQTLPRDVQATTDADSSRIWHS